MEEERQDASAEQPAEEPLEEIVLAEDENAVKVGDTLDWDGFTFTVEEIMRRGLIKGTTADGEAVLVRTGDASEWKQVQSHPSLPPFRFAGTQGYAVPWMEESPLVVPVPVAEVLAWVQNLAQLVRFFEAQGFAVIDLDPDHIVQTVDGPMLRLPPRLARIGQPLPPIYREGFTPPEVVSGGEATGKEGVYLLGALLYWMITGGALPAEGAGDSLLGAILVPGVPQLLKQCLAESGSRIAPKDFVASLRQLAAPPSAVLRVGSSTTVGLNVDRPVNEDSHGYLFQVVEAHGQQVRLLRAVLCDGMGGMAAGEVASRAAVDAFLQGQPPRLDRPEELADWAVALGWQANRAVIDAMAGQNGGCTLTAVVCLGSRYVLAHVGDSRAYRFSQGILEQISQDHSLVAALVAGGLLTPEEAAVSPDRNKVLRSLGSVRQEQPGYVSDLGVKGGARWQELQPGDSLLLVSDGVWGEVGDEVITEVLAGCGGDPQAATDALVAAAIAAGAPDNATALLVMRTS